MDTYSVNSTVSPHKNYSYVASVDGGNTMTGLLGRVIAIGFHVVVHKMTRHYLESWLMSGNAGQSM